jgi:hypothetical protein
MKRYWLNTLLALLAFLLATGIWFYDTYVAEIPIGEYPQAITMDRSAYNFDWQLGDEIQPVPYDNGLDCRDETLYSLLFIQARRYEPVIMKGTTPFGEGQHVWLEVTDNGTLWIYDWGLPISDNGIIELFDGKPISYRQLLGYAMHGRY